MAKKRTLPLDTLRMIGKGLPQPDHEGGGKRIAGLAVAEKCSRLNR